MPALIVYATRSGLAGVCAEALSARLPDPAVHDLAHGPVSPERLRQADVVVIGSGVRMRRLHPRVRRFAVENLASLMSRKVAVYLCGYYPDTHRAAATRDLPPALASHATCLTSLGGLPPFSAPDATGEWVSAPGLAALIDVVRSPDTRETPRARPAVDLHEEEQHDVP